MSKRKPPRADPEPTPAPPPEPPRERRPPPPPPPDALGAWLWSFVTEPRFVERYPLYTGVLARLRPVADPSVDVMAVSFHGGRFYLHVNVDYFQQKPHYLLGVLLHEVHHIVLGHLTHPKFDDPAQPDLMDIAKEISANEFIEEPLPPAIVLRDFEALGLRPHQSTLQRYERLVELRREQRLKPIAGRLVDDHRKRGEPGPDSAVRQLIEGAVDDLGDQADDDDLRLAGRRPQQLLEQLDAHGPPRVPIDWRTALRMFTARQRAPRHSYARPNRRFPARIGEVPGRIYTAREIEQPDILVALDTSGSVSKNDLDEIGRQLARLAQHARFLIAECDTQIHRVYPFPGRLDTVVGRGGTDLRPIFHLDFLRRHRVQGVIYFTDGLGPWPDQPPPLSTLWVLSGTAPFDCPWGQQVRM